MACQDLLIKTNTPMKKLLETLIKENHIKGDLFARSTNLNGRFTFIAYILNEKYYDLCEIDRETYELIKNSNK